MRNVQFILPVKICNLPFIPAIIKIIKKTLMLSIQANVVGDRKGFLWKAGDAVYHIIFVDMHPEIIPMSCLSGYNLHPLEQKI